MLHLLAATSGPVFSPNPIDDLQDMLRYAFMRNALAAGSVVAVAAGMTGYFVVLRSLSFAGHALAEIGFAGATGAVALSVDPLLGLLVFSLGGGVAIGFLGRRVYGRDVAIGVVLTFALGLGSLFLTLYHGNANEGSALLFGDIYGISAQEVTAAVGFGVVTIAAVTALYRPLLFASLDPDVAEARGVPVRLLSVAFMGLVAFAVAVAVQVVGVLLIFALLVTPAAIAQRLTHRPGAAMVMSMALALVFTVAGVVTAYYVPPPPSFFITAIAFAAYLAARFVPPLLGQVRATPPDPRRGR